MQLLYYYDDKMMIYDFGVYGDVDDDDEEEEEGEKDDAKEAIHMTNSINMVSSKMLFFLKTFY